MHLYDSDLYNQYIGSVLQSLDLRDSLKNGTFLISGATGMIGSQLIDLLLFSNQIGRTNCRIIALVRDPEKAKRRFKHFNESNGLFLVQHDLNNDKSIVTPEAVKIDYLIHAASNTHPVQYAKQPVDTILTNIAGTNKLLRFAVEKAIKRTVFLSSVEVYGENRGDVEFFDESYCGYIDCNTLRAGYPEGKRAGEALCQAYIKQYDLDIIIARLARSYGPTLQRTDSKAMSQFIWNGLNGEDIILKSAGTQQYSYIHAADAALSILYLLECGNSGEAYNLVGKNSNITLKQLANFIAQNVGTKVIFRLPDSVELAGFSKATKAMMDSSKIEQLGFSPSFSLEDGIRNTLDILKSLNSTC